jgi:UDP-N-acetylmuramyl tripeptide synthase
MEVSSHSISQERIKGLNFKSKSLTSFSKDHLDYHKSIDNYRNTKESFFAKDDENIVICIDNDLGKKIAKKNNSALKVSLNNKKADIYLNKGSIHTPWGNIKSRLSIDSDFMLSNLLCALGIYGKINNNLEINLTDNKIFTLPGRLELIKVFEDKYCYIDYAHTPEALGSILRYLKSKYSGQVMCLFGCGGDRDISKRNEMGIISETNSDLQIITNDNPRNENPLNIARSITKKNAYKKL